MYLFRAPLSAADPRYDQPVPPATSLPLQQEQPLIGESMITAEQLEPQKPIDIEEPSLGMTSGSIASDPILQNSLQSVVNSKLGVPDSLSPDPLQISSSALGEVVELNEMRSKSPTREGSVPQWQMSDSDDDDLGIEAEVRTVHIHLHEKTISGGVRQAKQSLDSAVLSLFALISREHTQLA